MIGSAKIAISLPMEDLKRIEKIRKELKAQRSTVIDMAIRFWLDNMDKQKIIKQYEEGYRQHPESVEEVKAMEQISADAFDEEGWK